MNDPATTTIPSQADSAAKQVPPAAQPSSAPAVSVAPTARRRRVRWRVIALVSAFALGVLIAAGGLIVVALTRAAPSWWQVVDAQSPKNALHAERLEAGVSQALSQPRDSSTIWTARLTEADANIWLNARLRKWLESQPELGISWPEQLTQLRVSFQGDTLRVGAMIEQNGAKQVFSATLAPRFEKDGSLWMPAQSISLGRLMIPAGWVLGDDGGGSRAQEQTGKVSQDIARLPATRRVLSAFAGRNAVRQDPTVRLPDGRKVRILGISAKDGRLLITCQTLQRGETAPRPSLVNAAGSPSQSSSPALARPAPPSPRANHPPTVEREP